MYEILFWSNKMEAQGDRPADYRRSYIDVEQEIEQEDDSLTRLAMRMYQERS